MSGEGGGEHGSEVGVSQVQEKVGLRAPAGRGLVSGAGMRPHTLLFSPCSAKGGQVRLPPSPPALRIPRDDQALGSRSL